MRRPRLAIVGTRRMTAYGQHVTYDLAYKLAEQGIVIVSGLAYGVDATAHQAAIAAQGLTVAVLPGPINQILPVGNESLAHAIVQHGGALVSEYAPGAITYKQNFVARNRIVSGLADAILITEAGKDSGARHTADFALDQGRDILVTPGDITRPGSELTNSLIKKGHAAAITSVRDVLDHLGLIGHNSPAHIVRGRNADEQKLLDLLMQGVQDGDELLRQSQLDIRTFNQTLTMLEIDDKILALGANLWRIH